MTNEAVGTDRICIKADVVECDGFSLEYALTVRKNCDCTLLCEYLYDLTVTKRIPEGNREESAVIFSVSSVLERAVDMYECMSRNTVTPMCVAEFYEEYHSSKMN